MKLNYKLYLYLSLANLGWLKKSYPAKIMFVAFLGTHIPLLALLLSFIISNSYSWEMAARVLVIALLATLTGTAATLYAIHHLLAPVILTSAALQDYLNNKQLPDLPTEYVDEAGTLMADVSQTLHKLDELIHYITNYDELTGLPNQNLFSDRLLGTVAGKYFAPTHPNETGMQPRLGDRSDPTLSPPQNHQQLVAIFLLSIDDFVNLSHGLKHNTLNLLLRAVAGRLSTCVTQTDILAHLSKDEFAIARIDIPSFETVVKLSQLLLNTLAKPFSIDGNSIHITASIGITINDLNNSNGIGQLLQEAHIALSQAQKQGRSQYLFYSPEINARLQERLTLENELHGSLERNEMQVYYQPLVNLHNQQVTAIEALVRWQHPTLGLVSPTKFIPIVEANGLITSIGEWVLRTACAQNRAWQLAGLPPVRISVNLSARQFEQPNLVEVVSEILNETGLQPSYLELEVTESFLMTDVEQSVKILNQLRELGIWLALDDFGTGYCSLNYLTRFPVNMLKIDRSFVQDITSNPDSAAITDAIIALANSLQLKITAEGVETEEQLNYLRRRGCEEGQGFYFSRPVPADLAVEMLEKSFQQSR
ncbi:MAG: EAL domain-containing protein [Aulosira sp. DedQUE10]|nr:EAL domain-containing protein [Aulosira sp. DedQUE10]